MEPAESTNVAYLDVLEEAYGDGYREENSRTGVLLRAERGGHSFKLPLRDRLPIPGDRRYWPHVAAAELAWQFMGTRDATWILEKAPKLWSKFVEDGKVKTAYGHRWRKAFGRDQLLLAMRELKDNPSNRQLYVSAWDPSIDGLGGSQPPNVPCPVGFSLTRTGDEVHCSVFIRSSDVVVGLPYDVMCYALLTDAVAMSVDARPGYLHVTLAHPHVYEPHFKIVEEAIRLAQKGRWPEADGSLPHWPVEMVLENPDAYVEVVRRGYSSPVSRSPLPKLVA